MTAVLPRLHAVTSPAILSLSDLDARAAAIGAAGPVALHARGRRLSGRQLFRLGERLRRAAPASPVFVNDRADVAWGLGATGVHLPADGLPTGAVRGLVGPDILVGRSVHDAAEARAAAADGADYVFLGPIWETPSHPGRPGIGVECITASRPARVIAIGGVTPARLPRCLAAGAYGVAAISALWTASDPGSAAAEMLLLLEDAATTEARTRE